MKIYEVRKDFYNSGLLHNQPVWDSTKQEVKPGWATLSELWIIGPLPDPIHQHPKLFELVRNAFKVIWIPEDDVGIVIKELPPAANGTRFEPTRFKMAFWRARLAIRGRRRKDVERACMEQLEGRIIKTWPVHG